jgi:hypothetical protein
VGKAGVLDGGLAVVLQAATISIEAKINAIPITTFVVWRSIFFIKNFLRTTSKFIRANLSGALINHAQLNNTIAEMAFKYKRDECSFVVLGNLPYLLYTRKRWDLQAWP